MTTILLVGSVTAKSGMPSSLKSPTADPACMRGLQHQAFVRAMFGRFTRLRALLGVPVARSADARRVLELLVSSKLTVPVGDAAFGGPNPNTVDVRSYAPAAFPAVADSVAADPYLPVTDRAFTPDWLPV